MTRARLFVDRGSGPELLRVVVRRHQWAAGCFHNYRGISLPGVPVQDWRGLSTERFVSADAMRKLGADAPDWIPTLPWWLVECASPLAGEKIIACPGGAEYGRGLSRTVVHSADCCGRQGRIIASGGTR